MHPQINRAQARFVSSKGIALEKPEQNTASTV
jgi:hypothetical protein